MKKICRLFTIIFTLVCLFVVASCGKKSGVEALIESKVYSTRVEFTINFSENSNISDGLAVPHMKKYEYDEDADHNVGDYLSENKTCSFDSGVYSSSKLEFTGLTAGTKYTFVLYVTYNESEETIDYVTIETKKTGSDITTTISTVDEFLAMEDDPECNYELANDIDFNGKKISAIFQSTTTKNFSGIFDGKGYSLKNFTLDTSNYGVFAYTNGATIKNLNLKPNTTEGAITADLSSGKSGTANLGILVGQATDTIFENVTIDSASFKIKASSSSTKLNVGIVVGKAENCSFKNVIVKNSSIEFTMARQEINTGLFAGVIDGQAVVPEGSDLFAVDGCGAEGTLTVSLQYSGTTYGYVNAAGFAGRISSANVVKDTYSVVDAKVYRNEEITTTNNKVALSVAGFVAETVGNVDIEKCAAVADIAVYAYKKDIETVPADEDLTKLTNAYANIAGFAATLNPYINKMENCVVLEKTAEIVVKAKAQDDEGKDLFVQNATIATAYAGANITSVSVLSASTDLTIFADSVKAIITEYNVA